MENITKNKKNTACALRTYLEGVVIHKKRSMGVFIESIMVKMPLEVIIGLYWQGVCLFM